jgi:hypothetical protein
VEGIHNFRENQKSFQVILKFRFNTDCAATVLVISKNFYEKWLQNTKASSNVTKGVLASLFNIVFSLENV